MEQQPIRYLVVGISTIAAGTVHAASKAATDVCFESEIQQIAGASREHVETTPVIAYVISRIRDGILATEDELPRAATSATVLSERGEMLFDVLSDSNAKISHARHR